ncbi:MAG: integrase arm-type DNA-binding domain-containing protein, partial [Alphaproteobacteria bacterium]|nr:integrase arm-type DNA-binding domain-containing protein [Alphaproteobacteria bacterium]
MPKLQLTDPTIRALKVPPSGQVTYWDNKLPGFGCRISQGGQKTFVVMYGPRELRRRKVVGKYPVQSLKDARDEAKMVMAEITLGIIEARAVSFSYLEAVERYLAEVRQRTRPRTIRDYERLLLRFFPFGKRQLSDITKQDIERCLSKL